MAAEFSDPAWWPKPPPKPPKPISMTKVVFGTLAPDRRGGRPRRLDLHPARREEHRAGKVDRRLRGLPAGARGDTRPGRRTATQQAVQACAGSLPTGTQLSAFGLGFGRPRNRQQGTAQAFAECMQSATVGLAGGGRFGPASARNAVHNAEKLCHTLVPGSGGTPTTTQVTPTVTAPPAT